MKRNKNKLLGGITLVGMAFIVGCSTSAVDSQKAAQASRTGDISGSVETLYEGYLKTRKNPNAAKRDGLLMQLAMGKELQELARIKEQNGQVFFPPIGMEEDNPLVVLHSSAPPEEIYEASNAFFTRAGKGLDFFDLEADVKVADELKIAATRPDERPYDGMTYDRIMLFSYMTLNYLRLGEVENAAASLRRAMNEQKLSIARYAKKLEQAQLATEEQNQQNKEEGGLLADAENEEFKAKQEEAYAGLEKYAPYGELANPFTTWLQGIFFLYNAADREDLSVGEEFLERTYGMIADKGLVRADLDLARKVVNRDIDENSPELTSPGVAYVLFETGAAPSRGQVNLKIPFPTIDGSSWKMMDAAFPTVEPNPDYIRRLTVYAGNAVETTAVLSDMDRVVVEEFKYSLPLVVLRTMLSVALKSAGEDMTQSNFMTNVVLKIINRFNTVADKRCWVNLPKQIQLARVEIPADGVIRLEAPAQAPVHVRLKELSGPTLVHVSAPSSRANLRVAQIPLRPSQAAAAQASLQP